MRGLRRFFLEREAGSTAAEFALVCFPVVILLFGIIQFSLVLYSYNSMKNAAREGVRWYAVGAPDADVSFGGNDKLAAEARAQGFLGIWAPAIVNATALNTTGDASINCPADEPDPDCDVTVTITAAMADAAIFDLLDLMTSNGFQLETSATMRRER
jgi:Flp pilus assembly protein TadG